MAIDTKAKRASAAGLALPFLLGVVPDVAQPQGWRQAAGWSYYGIDAEEPAVEGSSTVVVSFGHRNPSVSVRHRNPDVSLSHRNPNVSVRGI